MLNWRKEKGGANAASKPAQKAKAGSGANATPERKSRPVAETDSHENAASPTGPDNRRRLGEMLVGEGIISQKQLDEALDKKENHGGFVGQILVELGHIRQNDLISFLVKQCKIPHISLADYHINNELLSLVPEEICVQHGLLPIDKLGKILTVAMVDPLDADALEAVRQACPDLRIKPILCDWNHFSPACERLFSRSSDGVQKVTASSLGLSETAPQPPKQESETPPSAETAESTPSTEPVMPKGPQEAEIEVAVDARVKADLAPETKQAPASTPAPVVNIDAEQIAAQLREGMRDVIASLEQSRNASAAPAPIVNIDAEQIAAHVRDGMRDVIASLEQSRNASAAPAPIVNIDAEQIAAHVRDGMRDVIASLEQSRNASAAPAPDYAELGKLMRESVEQGMAKSTASLLKGMQVSLVQAAAAKKDGDKEAVSTAQIAEALRLSIEETMQKTLGELSKNIQNNSPKIELPAVPSAGELAKAVGESMQQALGTMAQEFSAIVEKESKRSEDTQQALMALHEAFAGNKSADAAQSAQLMEIAEAAKRAAQTAEKAIESIKEAKEAEEKALSKDNVREFPGAARKNAESDLNAMDALDSPGLAARTNEQVRAALENERPIPGYTFADFVPGKTNELTVTLCKALADRQFADLTPFYLYGGVGLGKSHLFNAIGNNIMAKNPDMRIGYVSAGMMARKFTKALAEDHALEVRGRYCDLDVLLIDDIHLLADKPSAQEEVLYILDAFLHEARPILLAGNASPDKLSRLDPCLASRLFSGVVSSVRAPEQAARIEMLTRMAHSAEADVPKDIVKLIAMQIQDDMRKMTGALRKVIAYARVSGHAIDKNLAGEVLSQLGVDAA
ncbi:MAG TPA: DnaA/Hda family protein [Candidatus Hydrogenedentes bacterium]|nr:DnaA/Hda family protein [Candidatus Hydrogenedentota bacterium]